MFFYDQSMIGFKSKTLGLEGGVGTTSEFELVFNLCDGFETDLKKQGKNRMMTCHTNSCLLKSNGCRPNTKI